MYNHHHHHFHEPAHNKLADDFILKYLTHAGFDGLGMHAFEIALGEFDEYQANILRVLFPSVPNDCLTYAHQYADSVMINAISDDIKGVRAILFHGLMARYEFMKPYRLAIQKSALHFSLPHQIPLGIRLVADSADALWQRAGDNSVDFNYYTKRALLMGVISATLPVYCNDKTENLHETADFLRHRLDNVVAIGKNIHQASQKFSLPRPFKFAQIFNKIPLCLKTR